ncbi:MAG: hypothetical protein OQJ99_08685 [Rhodospirillales bacterium]|nr:hypothetical protein [Rhodospirillales bacterium]
MPISGKPKTTGQEGLLLDYIQRLEQHKKGRHAVHIHLSRLKPFNRRDHHIRAATSTFDGMVRSLNGQIFVLDNTDIIVIYKAGVQGEVDQAIRKIRFLFGDDPLLAENMEDEGVRFCTWYKVDTQYEELVRLARTLVDRAKRGPEGAPVATPAAERERPLTPKMLGRVEGALARADLDNMLRRQYVCTLRGNVPEALFSELFISIGDLRETLLPRVNLASSPWLFHHLTETLDKRVLAMLAKTGERTITGEISLNLNVGTLLSPEFLHFDDNVIASMRGNIIIELQKVDVFADLDAYLFAREFVRERKYRICIDGLTYLTLPFVDRERLGADMIKLVWNPDILDQGRDAIDDFRRMVKAQNGANTVLCRCDNRDAVEFGQSAGIMMYQGRYIEKLIAEENRKRSIRKRKTMVQ